MTAPHAGLRPRVGGVAGGVGTSTIASLVDGADVGAWSMGPLDVLVCRPTASSTAAAQRILGGDFQLLGCRPVLVVISDGLPGTPADSAARLTMLRPLCRAVIELPYAVQWRQSTCAAGDVHAAPASFTRAVNRIRAALDQPRLSPLPSATRFGRRFHLYRKEIHP